MKRLVIYVVLTVCLLVPLHSGFYFDGGAGIGFGTSKIDGNNITDNDYGGFKTKPSFEFGFRGGFALTDQLFITGEYLRVQHSAYMSDSDYEYSRWYDAGYEVDIDIKFGINYFGAGVIFYPIPMLQLGASLGLAVGSYKEDISYTEWYWSDWGDYHESESYSGSYDISSSIAFNMSAAFDIALSENHGLLAGVRFFRSGGKISGGGHSVSTSTQTIGAFARYRYKHTDRVTQLNNSSHNRTTPRVRTSSLDLIAGQALRNVPQGSRVATIYISAPDMLLSDQVTEQLESFLINRHYRIVTRSQLSQIRSERGFLQTYVVDDRIALEIGETAEADFIITGRIDRDGNRNQLNLRVLNVSTREVVGIASDVIR
jgi:hypothetical protein